MVATINSLPLKLIRLILASACPVLPPEVGDGLGCAARYSFLPATALVCSAWRLMSQELLWEDVLLRTSAAMAAFVGAPRLTIKYLRLYYDYDDHDPEEEDLVQPEVILKGVRGVERLYIARGVPISPRHVPVVLWLDDLCGEGFKDLKVLHLDAVQLNLEANSIVLPFALEKLDICLGNTTLEHLSGPLATLCQRSIRELVVEIDSDHPPWLLHLLPIAYQLITFSLELTCSSEEEPIVPTFLRACNHLEVFELAWLRPGWLEALSNSLVELKLMRLPIESAESLVEMIRDGVIGVSKLEKVNVRDDEFHYALSMTEDATEEGTARRELATICREKGIKIVETLW